MSSVTIEEIQKAIQYTGLSWRKCSSFQWQVRGGVNIVNVFVSKKGVTFHVQGFGKGMPVESSSQIIQAARNRFIQPEASVKTNEIPTLF
jgi:hypothetical protein